MLIGGELMDVKDPTALLETHRKYFAAVIAQDEAALAKAQGIQGRHPTTNEIPLPFLRKEFIAIAITGTPDLALESSCSQLLGSGTGKQQAMTTGTTGHDPVEPVNGEMKTCEEVVEEALLWCPLVSGRTHSMTLAWFVALCSRNSSPFCFSGNRAREGNEWKPISLDVQCLQSPYPCLRIIGLSREMINIYNGRGMSDSGRGRMCSNCGKLLAGTVDGVPIEACAGCHSANGLDSWPDPSGSVQVAIRGSLLLPFSKDKSPQLEIDVQYE